MLVKLLEPLGVVDVRLAPGDVLRVSRVDEEDFEATCLKNLVDGNPINAGGLHRDGGDADLREPVRELMQLAGEASECPHAIVSAIRRNRYDVERRSDVQASCIRVDPHERSSSLPLPFHVAHRLLRVERR
jgi:hypothetical protein